MKAYILEGPSDVGNLFGYCKTGGLKAGLFAVVTDDEYANGGRGPCTVDGVLYRTRSEAQAAMERYNARKEGTP